jgi:hypothetical protein
VVGKERGSKIVNLLITNVSRCIGSNVKTFGLKHQQLPDMGASGGPPEGAHVVCVFVCVYVCVCV